MHLIWSSGLAGKSLDVIMQLREKAGERSVFDVVNKLEKKKKKQEEKLATAYNKPQQPSVFDFINKKLHGKKGKCTVHLLLVLSS